MLIDAQMPHIVTAIGLFGLCYGLLRVVKQVVDRRWPRDLVRGPRVYPEPAAPRVIAVPVREQVPVTAEPARAVAWNLAPETPLAARDVAGTVPQ